MQRYTTNIAESLICVAHINFERKFSENLKAGEPNLMAVAPGLFN